MTKLMEWLGVMIAFLAVYLYLITGETNLSNELMLHIKLLPIYLVGLFGVSNWNIFCFGSKFWNCPKRQTLMQKIEHFDIITRTTKYVF